jgi:hypothetical protein
MALHAFPYSRASGADMTVNGGQRRLLILAERRWRRTALTRAGGQPVPEGRSLIDDSG